MRLTHCNGTSWALMSQPQVWSLSGVRGQHVNLSSPRLRYSTEPKLPTQSPVGHWFYWNPIGWSMPGKESAQFPLLFVLTVGVKAFPSIRTVTVYSRRGGDSASPCSERSPEQHHAFARERLHLPCCPLGRPSVRNRDPVGLPWVDEVLKSIDL